MSDAADAVRKYLARLTTQSTTRAKNIRAVRRLGLVWMDGHERLYKFKSLSGASRKHVMDMIRNARVYFSAPFQFNDPLDCAPVFKTAKPISHPGFVEELLADEIALATAAGKSPKEIAAMRRVEGVPPEKLAAAVTARMREILEADTRVFCLSASGGHPLLWSHYADSHRGVCLHFRAAPGSLFGLARAVKYRKYRLPILVPLKYNRVQAGIAEKMALVKAESWRYEDEYRIMAHAGTDWGFKLVGQRCSFPPRLLCGLTLGMKIAPRDRRNLIALATRRYPPIAVYQAEEDSERFRIDSVRIA